MGGEYGWREGCYLLLTAVARRMGVAGDGRTPSSSTVEGRTGEATGEVRVITRDDAATVGEVAGWARARTVDSEAVSSIKLLVLLNKSKGGRGVTYRQV